MSNILEPNFNGLPPVNDWEKVFVALQQANEKVFRGASLQELGKQIVGDVAIQGADFEDLPIATSAAPVALPVPEAEMKFGFLANGTYTQPNGPNLVYTDVQWGLTLFDGTKWVKKFTLTIPKGKDGKTIINGVVDPTNAEGLDGDFYINTSSNKIFGPKKEGVWPAGVPYTPTVNNGFSSSSTTESGSSKNDQDLMLLNELYSINSPVYNNDGIMQQATILWQDGKSGVLTFRDYNGTWQAYDSYTVSYGTKTVAQPKITRDDNGNINVLPLKTIS